MIRSYSREEQLDRGTAARRKARRRALAAQARKPRPERCERCGTVGPVDLHHMAGRVGPWATEPENEAYLCRPCHGILHGEGREVPVWAWFVPARGAGCVLCGLVLHVAEVRSDRRLVLRCDRGHEHVVTVPGEV